MPPPPGPDADAGPDAGPAPRGAPVPGWRPPAPPARAALEGRWARLEPLDPDRHARDIHDADRADPEGRLWDYLPYGPFADLDALSGWMRAQCLGDDPMFFAVRDLRTGRVGGMCSWLRIAPQAGSIEVGHIRFGPRLQRSRAATDAMHLMMRRAFEDGYRRYEWKCDALNRRSRRAAQRLGLSFEGVFRQAAVVKGRNRDTAWFAAIDAEWPRLRAAFETWLDPANFDAEGRQRVSLSELTAPILVNRDA